LLQTKAVTGYLVWSLLSKSSAYCRSRKNLLVQISAYYYITWDT